MNQSEKNDTFHDFAAIICASRLQIIIEARKLRYNALVDEIFSS